MQNAEIRRDLSIALVTLASLATEQTALVNKAISLLSVEAPAFDHLIIDS